MSETARVTLNWAIHVVTLLTAIISIGINVGYSMRTIADHETRLASIEARERLISDRYVREREEFTEIKTDVRYLRDTMSRIERRLFGARGE